LFKSDKSAFAVLDFNVCAHGENVLNSGSQGAGRPRTQLDVFLKLKEFGGILLHSDESVSLSIVRVGPYLDHLVCIPPFIDYLFRVLNFLVSLF
jgi:hypothetical protein